MGTFANPIDTSEPDGNESVAQGDDRMRETKLGMQELWDVDHEASLTGTEINSSDSGTHNKCTFLEQISDPSAPTGVTEDFGLLYTKLDSDTSQAELFYKDENDNVHQLTRNGALYNPYNPTGSVTSYAGSSAPDGFLLCQGQAVSRTTYSDLFDIIGTTYGVGDGSTTFNIPDLKGRVIVGVGTGTDDNAVSDTFTLGGEEGEYKHPTAFAEMPGHGHQWYESSGGSVALDGTATSAARTFDSNGDLINITDPWDTDSYTANGNDLSIDGTAHNNIQPVIGLNYIIKT
jgi:microcystin-dependent protein